MGEKDLVVVQYPGRGVTGGLFDATLDPAIPVDSLVRVRSLRDTARLHIRLDSLLPGEYNLTVNYLVDSLDRNPGLRGSAWLIRTDGSRTSSYTFTMRRNKEERFTRRYTADSTTRELHPRVAVLLNITEDHLAWHRTHEAYAAAKRRIFTNLGTGDLAVISMDDPEAAASAPEAGGSGAAVLELALEDTGAEHAAFVRDGMLTVRLAGTEHALVPVSELGIAGDHNVTNALAASAAALWVGADPARVAVGLRSFAPLEHRIEPVATVDGVRYVNDSKATNTDAVEKALTAFTKDDVVLLLGGSDKGTPLEAFARRVAASTVKAVVCFGDAQERFSDAFRPAANTGELVLAQAADLADAVRVARTFAVSGDVVLLSPACASFDEFSGFEERGRRFKELVRALAPASASGARGLHG